MRSHYWDTWKGIAILAVVFIHVLASVSFKEVYSVVFRQLINFPVALFIAMAGFFAFKNDIGNVFLFWRTRFSRILPPYIFWTIAAIFLLQPTHFLSVSALGADFLLGKGIGYGVGYFVILLVQLVLLTPILLRLVRGGYQSI